MRKTGLVITILISVIMLTGCDNNIEVIPEVINVIYENPRYVDDSFFIDTYITNGFEEDMYIGMIDFSIYPESNETEIVAAGFYIEETIKAGGYVSIELEFTGSYVFVTEDELTILGFGVDDLILFFTVE